MTKQIQISQRRLDFISRYLKELFIAYKVFSTCVGGNYRWVPLKRLIYLRLIFWLTKFAFYTSIFLCVWVKELSNDVSTELLTETAISS